MNELIFQTHIQEMDLLLLPTSQGVCGVALMPEESVPLVPEYRHPDSYWHLHINLQGGPSSRPVIVQRCGSASRHTARGIAAALQTSLERGRLDLSAAVRQFPEGDVVSSQAGQLRLDTPQASYTFMLDLRSSYGPVLWHVRAEGWQVTSQCPEKIVTSDGRALPVHARRIRERIQAAAAQLHDPQALAHHYLCAFYDLAQAIQTHEQRVYHTQLKWATQLLSRHVANHTPPANASGSSGSCVL